MPLSLLDSLVLASLAAPASEPDVWSPFEAAAVDASPSPEAGAAPVPTEGATPFADPDLAPMGGEEPLVVAPLDDRLPEPDLPTEPPDPRKAKIVRLDLLVGPVFRIRRVDTLMGVGLEYGRKHGFSGTFHTELIVASDRDLVRVLDFPIGVGAVARGRLPGRGFYGSVGLTAGILVHRAAIFDFSTFEVEQVIHRVDPDFRLPIGFGWTAQTVGVSLAIVQGYSVRSRTYERRGAEVWHRHAYRIGLVLGLHFDIATERPKDGRSKRGRGER